MPKCVRCVQLRRSTLACRARSTFCAEALDIGYFRPASPDRVRMWPGRFLFVVIRARSRERRRGTRHPLRGRKDSFDSRAIQGTRTPSARDETLAISCRRRRTPGSSTTIRGLPPSISTFAQARRHGPRPTNVTPAMLMRTRVGDLEPAPGARFIDAAGTIEAGQADARRQFQHVAAGATAKGRPRHRP